MSAEEEESLEELAKRKLKKELEEDEASEIDEKAYKVAELGFKLEKKQYAEKYPEYANRIMSCTSPYEMEDLVSKIEEDEIPATSPAGSVSLPNEQAIPTIKDEEEFDSPRALMNDLVQKMMFGNPKQKASAKAKYEKLLQSMISNPSFGKLATTKAIRNMPTLIECPKCYSLIGEGERFCDVCGHDLQGEGYFTSPATVPSKIVTKKG